MTKQIKTTSSWKAAVLAVACAGALGAAALSGCSAASPSSEDTSPAETSAAVPAAAEESSALEVDDSPIYTVEAGDESASAGFILENGLGKKISGIAMAPSAEENAEAAFTECPFTVGDSLAPDQAAYVHYDNAADAYDVQLTTMEGDTYKIHNLPLAAIEGAIRIELSEDNIAYASYEENGEKIDTLAAEQDLAAAAETAEEEAPAEATYEDTYDYTYDTGYDYSGAQTGDGCVSDIVLR